MKGGTVQINWHDTKPVLTLDFHPLSGLLATGGADFDIKVILCRCHLLVFFTLLNQIFFLGFLNNLFAGDFFLLFPSIISLLVVFASFFLFIYRLRNWRPLCLLCRNPSSAIIKRKRKIQEIPYFSHLGLVYKGNGNTRSVSHA